MPAGAVLLQLQLGAGGSTRIRYGGIGSDTPGRKESSEIFSISNYLDDSLIIATDFLPILAIGM
jgi:hypothetical protein